MKKTILILIMLTKLFGDITYQKIDKPLLENDFFGNWNYYSLNNKNKEENVFFNEKKKGFPISLHFNKGGKVTVMGSELMKTYMIYNNKLAIGDKMSVIGLDNSEEYKIIAKMKNSDEKECFVLEKVISIYNEQTDGIICKY